MDRIHWLIGDIVLQLQRYHRGALRSLWQIWPDQVGICIVISFATAPRVFPTNIFRPGEEYRLRISCVNASGKSARVLPTIPREPRSSYTRTSWMPSKLVTN